MRGVSRSRDEAEAKQVLGLKKKCPAICRAVHFVEHGNYQVVSRRLRLEGQFPVPFRHG